jgi:hypothetical protein
MNAAILERSRIDNSRSQRNPHCPSSRRVLEVPAGGLSADRSRWVRPRYPFFLPVKVLSRVFRGKFCAGLKRLYRGKRLRCAGPASALANPQQFQQLLRRLHRQDWVVYAKAAFGGPLRFSVTSADTRSGSPPPTTDCLRLMVSMSYSGGKITLTGQAAEDDAPGNRVPAAVLPPCLAQGLRSDPPLRFPLQSVSRLATPAMPAAVGDGRTRTAITSPAKRHHRSGTARAAAQRWS